MFNIVQSILRLIMEVVLSRYETIQLAMSAYIDDGYVNSSMEHTEWVEHHFPVRAAKQGPGAPWGRHASAWIGNLGEAWPENAIPNILEIVAWRSVFSLSGILIEHWPEGWWLRESVGIVKRRVNADPRLRWMSRYDKLFKRWQPDWSRTVFRWVNVAWRTRCQCVSRRKFPLTGVFLEGDYVALEDSSRLPSMNDGQPINLAELDAVQKWLMTFGQILEVH